MTEPVTTAAGPSGWASSAALLAAASGFLLGLLAHLRERRRDKASAAAKSQEVGVSASQTILSGYGQFVEDLQHEVARLREELSQTQRLVLDFRQKVEDCEEARGTLVGRVAHLESRLRELER